MTKRCKHEEVAILESSDKTINVQCKQCGRGWFGPTYPFLSHRGNFRQAPRWVQRYIEHKKAPGKGRKPGART